MWEINQTNYWERAMANGWTPERRMRHAALAIQNVENRLQAL